MNLGEVQCLNALAATYIDDQDYGIAAQSIEAAISCWDDCSLAPTPIGEAGLKNNNQKVFAYFAGYLDYKQEAFVVHPVLFECERELFDACCVTEEQHSYIATLLCFNLGLCYHLSWLSCEENNEKPLLSKALNAYQQGYKLARSFLQELGSNAVSHHVVKAMCHNAAHCSLELGELQQAQFWNKQLIWAINVSLPHEREGEETEVLFFRFRAFLNRFTGTGAQAA